MWILPKQRAKIDVDGLDANEVLLFGNNRPTAGLVVLRSLQLHVRHVALADFVQQNAYEVRF